MCLSFKSPPNDEKKNQLKANGFVWNSGKFRWEAMPTDTALGLGRRILDSYSHLIKAHKGLEPPPAETATGQDGDDHDPPPPDGGETPPATEDAPAAASDVDNPTGMAGGDSGDPPSDDQTEDDAPDFDEENGDDAKENSDDNDYYGKEGVWSDIDDGEESGREFYPRRKSNSRLGMGSLLTLRRRAVRRAGRTYRPWSWEW